MQFYIKMCFICTIIIAGLASCQQEDIDVIDADEPQYTVDTVSTNPIMRSIQSFSVDFINIECLSVPYPVTFLQQSGSTVTISSPDELEAAEMLVDSIVNFVYPFDALDANASPVVISGIEDLVFQITLCSTVVNTDCDDLDAHVILFFNSLNILTINKYEYNINYPVTLVVEGLPITLASDDDYLPAIGGSPFSYLDTELQYPITITQFGRDIVLNSDDEVCKFYATLDEPCEDKPAHIQFFYNGAAGSATTCVYNINYPVNIVSNGSTVTLESRQEYLDVLTTLPSSYDDIQLVYPVSLTKSNDGQILIMDMASDICDFLENCQ